MARERREDIGRREERGERREEICRREERGES